MFADDTKISKAIKLSDDASSLQTDLNNLEAWSSVSGHTFNANKCKSQSITQKTKPIVATYILNDNRLESTKTKRDLGVWIAADFTWDK